MRQPIPIGEGLGDCKNEIQLGDFHWGGRHGPQGEGSGGLKLRRPLTGLVGRAERKRMTSVRIRLDRIGKGGGETINPEKRNKATILKYD